MKKPTKAQKQYAKSHKRTKGQVVKKKTVSTRKATKPATTVTKARKRTVVTKNTNPDRRAPYTVIMEEHFEDISKGRQTNNNLTKNKQKATKTPRKTQNGPAQRQIKVINIRI